MHYGRNRTHIGRARSLRENMTREERHLWYDFLRYCRPRFRRQEIISNYILDFSATKPNSQWNWMAPSIVTRSCSNMMPNVPLICKILESQLFVFPIVM